MRTDGAIKKMFLEIWEEREHVSEISGKPLIENRNHWQFHWQFAHVLSKNVAPSYALRKYNIMLMTPEEHENQESYPKFIERREELKRQYNEESIYSYGKFS